MSKFMRNKRMWNVSNEHDMFRLRLGRQNYLYLSPGAKDKMRRLSATSHPSLISHKRDAVKVIQQSRLKTFIASKIDAFLNVGILDGRRRWNEIYDGGKFNPPSRLFKTETSFETFIEKAKCLMLGKKFIKNPYNRAYHDYSIQNPQ